MDGDVSEAAAVFRERCVPMPVLPTGETPQLAPLPGVKAVVFDVYGTLFLSAAGGLPALDDEARGAVVRKALTAGGVSVSGKWSDGELGHRFSQQLAKVRGTDVAYPEVEIREVWQALLTEIGTVASGRQVARSVAAFECLTNPVWPVPGATEMIADLRRRNVRLGIVSNGQFYTRALFPALLGGTVEDLGFAPALQVWSYELRESKPSTRLYQQLAAALAAQGISPAETLYAGNDLRNDIHPAQVCGFRTALFAGDARSLRWRRNEPALANVRPDVILTEWAQLPGIIGSRFGFHC